MRNVRKRGNLTCEAFSGTVKTRMYLFRRRQLHGLGMLSPWSEVNLFDTVTLPDMTNQFQGVCQPGRPCNAAPHIWDLDRGSALPGLRGRGEEDGERIFFFSQVVELGVDFFLSFSLFSSFSRVCLFGRNGVGCVNGRSL